MSIENLEYAGISLELLVPKCKNLKDWTIRRDRQKCKPPTHTNRILFLRI
jgi:hypothetical protein